MFPVQVLSASPGISTSSLPVKCTFSEALRDFMGVIIYEIIFDCPAIMPTTQFLYLYSLKEIEMKCLYHVLFRVPQDISLVVRLLQM